MSDFVVALAFAMTGLWIVLMVAAHWPGDPSQGIHPVPMEDLEEVA